jgi:hypothetical protein
MPRKTKDALVADPGRASWPEACRVLYPHTEPIVLWITGPRRPTDCVRLGRRLLFIHKSGNVLLVDNFSV